MDVKGDRLSNLPDDVIHKILYFFDIKYAIKTSVLSSRWRYMWTSMPYLNFSSEVFSSLPKFSRFVTQVLSHRNSNVTSVKLSFRGKISQVFVKRILKYAFTHNVQQMTVTYLPQKKIEIPLCLFSFHSLKHLTLIGSIIDHSVTSLSTWKLSTLTTLHLDDVTLYDHASDKFSGLFSKCTNLKNLTLIKCRMIRSDGLSICHPKLSNLILENAKFDTDVERLKVVNVVAPQLKNLSLVLDHYYLQFISDSLPSLENVSLVLNHYILQFVSGNLPCLEKVDVRIRNPYVADAPKIVDLLQQFHNVKFLTLNLELIEALSSSVELISNQPSPFANLKSLKIYPVKIQLAGQAQKKVNVCSEVKNYLLDSSPGATFTMVSREEMRAVRNATLAQKRMAELQVLLDQEKAKTNNADMDHQKTPIESHKVKMHKKGKTQVVNKGDQAGMKVARHIGGKMERVQRCWEDLNVQIQLERSRAKRVFSKLQDIEELLTELPASKRVKMEPCFSSLCTEADNVMNEVILRMKTHCDSKRSRLSVYFHKLAKALQPSS